MSKAFGLALLACALCAAASGHEYWLEPDSFFLKPSEKTLVRLFLGEGLKKEEERPFQASKTNIFRLYSAGDGFDLAALSGEDEKPLSTFSSERSGTFLIAMERNWSYITLGAKEFQAYLRENGMEHIIDERERLGESTKEAKERYSRYLKALMQVGDAREKTFAKIVGLTLELTPLENPYNKKIGQTLAIQVLFRRKPLANAVVFADNRDGGTVSKRRFTTDEEGKVTVPLNRKGVWLVRLVRMERCTKNCEGAEWESFWATLSFGLR